MSCRPSSRNPASLPISPHANSGCKQSALAVLVVAPPPDACLIAAHGCTVEPLVRSPEAIEAARISRVGVIDGSVLQHERAHARPIAREPGRIGSTHGSEPANRLRRALRIHRVAATPAVVLAAARALLFLGE